MTIQPIGSGSIALYITSSDLQEQGLLTEDLNLERAMALTRNACAEMGLTLEGAVEIEAFPDTDGVLIFARVGIPETIYYSFDSLEQVIQAACALPSLSCSSRLFRLNGRYYVSLTGYSEQTENTVSEYGLKEPQCSTFAAYLREHGETVLESGALTRFQEHFQP